MSWTPAPGWSGASSWTRACLRGPPRPYTAWWTVQADLASVAGGPGDQDDVEYGAALAIGDLHPLNNHPVALAVGAPGFNLVDGPTIHTRVGAVEVHNVDLGGFDQGSTTAPIAVPPPFTGSTLWGPSDVCFGAASSGCVAQGSGGICVGAEFGASLAVGRFIEDGYRDLALDLAIGAPGSPGVAGLAGSGHVEILSGQNLLLGGSATIGGLQVGDDCADHVYLDSERFEQSFEVDWDVTINDYAPEAGDRYGSALFAFDATRTIFADEESNYRDELLIGAPFEALQNFYFSSGGSRSSRASGSRTRIRSCSWMRSRPPPRSWHV